MENRGNSSGNSAGDERKVRVSKVFSVRELSALTGRGHQIKN